MLYVDRRKSNTKADKLLTEFLIIINKVYVILTIILTAYKTPSSCKSLSLPDVNTKKLAYQLFPLSILLQNYPLKYDQTPPYKHLYKVSSS